MVAALLHASGWRRSPTPPLLPSDATVTLPHAPAPPSLLSDAAAVLTAQWHGDAGLGLARPAGETVLIGLAWPENWPEEPCLGRWPGTKHALDTARWPAVPCRPDPHRAVPGPRQAGPLDIYNRVAHGCLVQRKLGFAVLYITPHRTWHGFSDDRHNQSNECPWHPLAPSMPSPSVTGGAKCRPYWGPLERVPPDW